MVKAEENQMELLTADRALSLDLAGDVYPAIVH
jgi:hypothetical protein